MTFYGIEITFYRQGENGSPGQVLSLHTYCNCTGGKVREIRETILNQGLQVPVTLSQWAVIFPAQIISFTVFRQDSYFNNLHSDLKKTVFAAPEGETQKMI